jgi:PPOX class probable F420-dependent enzyme
MSQGPTNSSSPIRNSGSPATLDPKLVALAAAHNIGALATIKTDGRPRLSAVNFTLDPATALARISVIEDRVMVHDLHRDPRASIFVASPDGRAFAVLEGTVELSPVAAVPDDDTVEELIEVYRSIRGVNHPEWDDFRAAMVADCRLVARLHVELAYGLPGPDFDIPA